MAENKSAERKLISFANPQVKYALDKQPNASALVEALVANHLGVEFDPANPTHAERVQLHDEIASGTTSAVDAPKTVDHLLEQPEIPADSHLGIQEDAPVNTASETLPEIPADVLPTPEPEPEELELPEKPKPMSTDFMDLAGDSTPNSHVGVSDEVTAVLNPEPEVSTPAFVAQPQTPAFVPTEPKPSRVLPVANLDEPKPAEEAPAEQPEEVPQYAAGTKVCPKCGREVLLSKCLNCGHEFK